ncbi:MAG: hypothetical protein ACI35O_14210 [Bacillaceae bacterium]
MKKIYLIFGIVLPLILTGCNNEMKKDDHKKDKLKEVQIEKKVETFQISNMVKKDVFYTEKSSVRGAEGWINNIQTILEEYYNENNKMYSYVLTLDETHLIPKDSGSIPYKTIKISVGAMPSSETDFFQMNASSPIYKEALNPDFGNKPLFLFSSKNRLSKEEMRIELVLVNAKPFDNNKAESKTFRMIEKITPKNDDETQTGNMTILTE